MNNPFPHLQSFTDFDRICPQLFSLPFDRYIEACRTHIQETRERAHLHAELTTVDMNCPFIREPEQPSKHGVLMIHGFMSSPYMMRTLATLYQSMGFVVYAILLPGHGTLPGELMRTSHLHWISAAEYGLRELSKRVSDIHLCGFSTGGTLCGLLAQQYPELIKSIAMFVPAFGITPAARFLPLIHFLTYFLSDTSRFKWVSRLKEHHLTAYLSTPYRGGLNVKRIIDQFFYGDHSAFQKIPSFWTAIEKDGVVSLPPIMNFFKTQTSAQSEMIYYHSSEQHLLQDPRILCVNDTTLQDNILQLSHVAPIVPPNEPYYGEHGALLGASSLHSKTVFGEMLPGNLIRPHFKRLSFNPDFAHLQSRLSRFLQRHMD
jgi:esterase/lipase